MAIAIFRSLEGESLEDVANRLFQNVAPRLDKTLDNGVLLVLFVQDRKLRIEVGYGLEAVADRTPSPSQIIREALAPRREQRCTRRGSKPPWSDGIRERIGAFGAPESRSCTAAASRRGLSTRRRSICCSSSRARITLPSAPRVECVASARLTPPAAAAGSVARHGRLVRRRLGGGGWGGGGGSSGGGFWRWWQLGRRRRERELVMARHPKWAQRFLSEADFDAITQAIKGAEARTCRRRSACISSAVCRAGVARRRH